jgi:hypothetical protein
LDFGAGVGGFGTAEVACECDGRAAPALVSLSFAGADKPLGADPVDADGFVPVSVDGFSAAESFLTGFFGSFFDDFATVAELPALSLSLSVSSKFFPTVSGFFMSFV